MKNKFLITIGVIIVILIAIIFIFKKDEVSYLREITYKEYAEKIDNKDSFILYIKQNNCQHCLNFTPVLENVLTNYKVTAYYLNLTNLSESDYNSLKQDLSFSGTPTVMFFESGIELGTFSRISGEKSEKFVIERLKNRGYIKK